MLTYPSFFNGVAAPYQIEQSLRFAGETNQYLYRTGAITAQGGVSLWVKFHRDFGSYTSAVADPIIYLSGGGPWIYRNGYGYLYYRSINTGGDSTWSGQRCRDHSAWYHIFLKFNSSNSTSLYVNNVLWGTQSTNIGTSSGDQRIGYDGAYYGRFNLAEYHAAFGESLDATDFGEYDDNGVWVPKEFTGNYGSQGFYLKFDPSAANGLGHDHSGNGNHFTDAGGFTTSGTGTDVMSDTPTTNWCTLNPLFVNNTEGPGTLSEGNLRHTSDDNYAMCPGTMSLRNGKYYWEAQPITSYVNIVGIIRGMKPAENTYIGSDTNGNVFGFGYQDNGWIRGAAGTGTTTAATLSTSQNTYTTTDIIGIAVDIPNGTLDWYKNGTLEYSVTGINDEEWFPAVSSYGFNTWEVNFGQRAFAYTPPAGFKPLNTSNLSAPPVKDGSKNFNTVLWTGTGGSGQSITGVGFQPDLVWIKDRNVGYDHVLQDAVRGTGEEKKLYSSRIDNEASTYKVYGNVSSFDTDGFTVANGSSGDQHVNQNTYPYVAWNWLAGNGTSSIAAGSIDGTNPTIASTVSANPTAGFSIVTYAGNGTGGATIGHGLGVPPQLIIAKNRGGGPYPTSSWGVYHEALGASKWLTLDSTAAASGPYSNPGNLWYNTAPTSTVFYVGNLNETNGSNNYVAYCFAEVEGYSKFGLLTPNYNANGTFVYLGFTPAFLMFKNAERAGTDWVMIDATRDPYNYAGRTIKNRALTEDTYTEKLDILSNGFKIRTTDLNYNGPDTSPGIIYVAFASNPFGGSGVSPATAR